MENKSNLTPPSEAASAIARDLAEFIAASPTPFHAVENAIELLKESDFAKLSLEEEFLSTGRFYYTRNQSSLIAVSIQAPLEQGFAVIGAHTDSPCLKVKPNPAYQSQGYLQLGVEVYGGALLAPWFDRDLSLAGRLSVTDSEGKLHSRLIDFKRPIGVIPNLAIHLNRDVNEKNDINRQKHLPPLLDAIEDEVEWQGLLLDQLAIQYPGESFDKILAFELSLYDVQKPAIVGLRSNLVAAARLDNLLSCYMGLRAMQGHGQPSNAILVLSDHEEIGSATAAGAAGPFLESVLRHLCEDERTYRVALERSMLVSADNAHAVHPNYIDKHEPRHLPMINKGPVIKINSNQRYATNSETHAMFASLCAEHGVPFQQFVVRSDMGCGSTIGPITATELGIRTIDIGVPQLAMHSIRELAGVQDCAHMLDALTAFYNQGPLSIS